MDKLEDNKDNFKSDKAYFYDSYLFEYDSIVKTIEPDEKDKLNMYLTFEKTIFHPQGGGQPADEGTIEINNKSIKINGLLYDKDRDLILHKVSKEDSDLIKLGDKVTMKINKEKRELHARIHSGGHLIDIAVAKLKLNLLPSKGYHFAEGPYVEYKGKLDNLDSYKEKFETLSNEVIDNSGSDKVDVQIHEFEEAKKLYEVPDYMPKDKPVRRVKLTDYDLGCPCGGTHVKQLKDIGKMKIMKLTKKKDIIRVSYQVC